MTHDTPPLGHGSPPHAVIESIQFLRAVAALMVLFFHAAYAVHTYGGYEYAYSNAGAAGVDIFFVVSGFVITYITSRGPFSPLDFMVRRLIRIAPVYWFYTTVTLVIILAMPSLARRPDRRLLRLAALFVEPGVAPSRRLEGELKALKYSNIEVKATVSLAEAVGGIPLAALAKPMDDATVRRHVARAGRLMVPGVARLLWARAKAARELDVETAAFAEGISRTAGLTLYRRALRSAWHDPLTLGDLAVDGDDLRSAGVPNGRAMGDTLARLLEAVIEDPSRNTREALLEMIKG